MTVWEWLLFTHPDGLLLYLAIVLLISIGNLFWLKRLETYPTVDDLPKVSVLIPARNEEHNITGCLESVLFQDYPHLEVIVLDDQSSDRTAEITRLYRLRDSRLRLIPGRALPPGWLGKPWACHQAAEKCSGDLLLFLDADTRLKPDAIRRAVYAMLAERAALLSVIPHEIVSGWGEKLIQPFFLWAVFTTLPLAIARKIRLPGFSFTIGQFLLFDRQAYQSVGGHSAIRSEVVDDLAFGRLIRRFGFVWRLVDGSRQVECRMYRSLGEVVAGFSKNFFAAFQYNVVTFGFVFTWLVVVYWQPILVLVLAGLGVPIGYFPAEKAAAAILLSVLGWLIPYVRLRFPVYLALFYPLTVLFNAVIAARSLVLALSGKSTWKDRRIARPKIRFF